MGKNSGMSESSSPMPVTRLTNPTADTCVGMDIMSRIKVSARFFSLKE